MLERKTKYRQKTTDFSAEKKSSFATFSVKLTKVRINRNERATCRSFQEYRTNEFARQQLSDCLTFLLNYHTHVSPRMKPHSIIFHDSMGQYEI